MHRSVLRLIVAVVVIAGCDSAPSAPVATPSLASKPQNGPNDPEGSPDHENKRVAFTGTVTNPCPPVPETVAVEGFTQFSSHFKFYDAGNTSRHHIMTQAKGVGAITGARYTFHELFTQTGDYKYATLVFSVEQTTRWHVISEGNRDNFFATSRQKMVCDQNGCRVEPISFESDCKG